MKARSLAILSIVLLSAVPSADSKTHRYNSGASGWGGSRGWQTEISGHRLRSGVSKILQDDGWGSQGNSWGVRGWTNASHKGKATKMDRLLQSSSGWGTIDGGWSAAPNTSSLIHTQHTKIFTGWEDVHCGSLSTAVRGHGHIGVGPTSLTHGLLATKHVTGKLQKSELLMSYRHSDSESKKKEAKDARLASSTTTDYGKEYERMQHPGWLR